MFTIVHILVCILLRDAVSIVIFFINNRIVLGHAGLAYRLNNFIVWQVSITAQLITFA